MFICRTGNASLRTCASALGSSVGYGVVGHNTMLVKTIFNRLLGVYWFIPPEPGVTRENFLRLHKGMTPPEIEKIMGSEGEWYKQNIKPQNIPTAVDTFLDHEIWVNDSCKVDIGYFAGEAAFGGFTCDGRETDLPNYPEESLSHRLRRWVKDWTGW